MLRQDPEQVHFEGSDDGYGFDLRNACCGAGLQNMHHRIGALEGALSVESTIGSGAVISGSIPITNAEGAPA
jgi:signal transduction histidine kinase